MFSILVFSILTEIKIQSKHLSNGSIDSITRMHMKVTGYKWMKQLINTLKIHTIEWIVIEQRIKQTQQFVHLLHPIQSTLCIVHIYINLMSSTDILSIILDSFYSFSNSLKPSQQSVQQTNVKYVHESVECCVLFSPLAVYLFSCYVMHDQFSHIII